MLSHLEVMANRIEHSCCIADGCIFSLFHILQTKMCHLDNSDPPMSRGELSPSPAPILHHTVPASERLKKYLKNLEKKLEAVSCMVDNNGADVDQTTRWKSSSRPMSNIKCKFEYFSESFAAPSNRTLVLLQ